MVRFGRVDKGRVCRLLGGFLLLVTLSGCLPAPVETAAPIAAIPTVTPTATVTSSETLAEPPAMPTVVPTATVAATSTTAAREPAATATPTATPATTPTQAPEGASPERYTVVGVAVDDVLNVRAGPSVANRIVGAIPPYGMGVRLTGEGQPVGGSNWVSIAYDDARGWVNGRYLARQVGTVDRAVAARSHQIVQALRDRGWDIVAGVVHPDLGVRFSPYAYVRAESGAPEGQDRVVRADEMEALAENPTTYRWGRYDGTGDPIDLTFAEYVEQFVYDVDFAQPHVVGYGETVGWGNTINNIADVYPEAVVVEYHFTGFDPRLMGMDWRSLRLALKERDGVWYLVGVVHDEWTI